MDLLDDILSSMDKNKRPALSQPDKVIQSEFKTLIGNFRQIFIFFILCFRTI